MMFGSNLQESYTELIAIHQLATLYLRNDYRDVQQVPERHPE